MRGTRDGTAPGARNAGRGVRDAATPRPLRADARDNRRRLLDAARDVFIEHGPGAPLDEIARRAGTGIATLYRRFPDRRTLLRDVVVDALRRTADEASQAAREEPDPFRALVRYMHRVIDVRTAAVIPALLGELPFDDEEIKRLRDTAPVTFQALVDAAQRAGQLRPDVTAGDIGMLIVRLSRPLPGGFARQTNDSLSHRHLVLLIEGLRTQQPAPLSGPVMTLDDLRQFPGQAAAASAGSAAGQAAAAAAAGSGADQASAAVGWAAGQPPAAEPDEASG